MLSDWVISFFAHKYIHTWQLYVRDFSHLKDEDVTEFTVLPEK
jgi:hypothetical protein